MVKLTVKQDAFVKAYLLNGGNATQAAITAGYSKKTANAIGTENLAKPSIAHAIKEHQNQNDSEFIFDKKAKLKLLQVVMKKCSLDDSEKGMLNANAVIAAVKEHNLMQGDNAPTESTNENTDIKEIKITVVKGND